MLPTKIKKAFRVSVVLPLVIAMHGMAIEYLLHQKHVIPIESPPSIEAHIISDLSPKSESLRPIPLGIPEPKTIIEEPTLNVLQEPHPAQQMTQQLHPHVDETLIASTGPRPNPDSPNTFPIEKYPGAVQRGNQECRIVLSLLVLANGEISDVLIDKGSGTEAIDKTAAEYARQHWRFLPGTRNGVPVADWKIATVIFRREEISIQY